MFAVDEATALAIRHAYQDGGELSGVVELRRHYPLITDNARALLCLKAIMSWTVPTLAPEPAWFRSGLHANVESLGWRGSGHFRCNP